MLILCHLQVYFGGGNCLQDVLNDFVSSVASDELYVLNHVWKPQPRNPDHSARTLNNCCIMVFFNQFRLLTPPLSTLLSPVNSTRGRSDRLDECVLSQALGFT